MNKKFKIMRNFTKSARVYDRNSGLQDSLENILLKNIKQDLRSAENISILDIGSGTGRLLKKIRKVNQRLFICGIDISWGMAEYANTRANKINKLKFIQADAENIPFRDNTFEMLLSSSTYQWITDHKKAFKEARRVLKRKGKFNFIFFGGSTLKELKNSFSLSYKYYGLDPLVHAENFADLKDINSYLVRSGFSKVSLSSFLVEKKFKDVSDLIKFLKTTGATNANLDASRGLGRKKIIMKMKEFYKKLYMKNGCIVATFEVFSGCAQK